MKKIVTIKNAEQELVVKFPCHTRCDGCPFRFTCYTTSEGLDLWCIDIDEKLRELPSEMLADLRYKNYWEIPDEEFYIRAFNLVTRL